MTLPSYDPAIVANIVSLLAFVLAALSYRQSRRAEISKRNEALPDVTATARWMEDRRGWIAINLEITNKFATALYVTGATLKRPKTIGAISEDLAWTGTSFDPVMKDPLPLAETKRTIGLTSQLDPAGTPRHPHGLTAGDRSWITFYVWPGEEPSSPLNIDFDVEFSVRKSDVRRKDRYVSHQRVRLPPRQTS